MSNIEQINATAAQFEKLEQMRQARNSAIAVAEKASYEYFCACDLGRERERASDVYENVRTALRVGP